MFKEKEIQEKIKKLYGQIEQQNAQEIINTKKAYNKDLGLTVISEQDIEHTIKMERRKLPESAKKNDEEPATFGAGDQNKE